MKWPLCGPKLSLCCSIISVWGIVQFALMGIFFIVQAAPLVDDFEFEESSSTDKTIFEEGLKHAFHQRAYNCWIAAALYVGLLVFAGMQFQVHLKRSSVPPAPPTITSPFAGITTETNDRNQPYGMPFANSQSES